MGWWNLDKEYCGLCGQPNYKSSIKGLVVDVGLPIQACTNCLMKGKKAIQKQVDEIVELRRIDKWVKEKGL